MTRFNILLTTLKKYLFILSLGIFISLSFGCAKNSKNAPVGSTKESLFYLKSSSKKSQSVSPLRVQMLRDTALSVGARGGLAHRAKEINSSVKEYNKFLDRVFNFYGMLLDNNVLPPVLTEGRNNLNQTGDDVIRVAERNYRIIKQARFVTAVPSWRDYLHLNYETPENPDRSLLPRNQAEIIVWKKYIDEGWKAGIEQAEAIFEENVFKLARDYKGMVLYRTLLAKNMVTPPYVSSVDLGVTGNDKAINVNDRVLRITAKPGLRPNSKEWKTTVTKHN